MGTPESYIIAEGPEGLKKILEELLEKTKQDAVFAKQAHYVLYQLGNLKSMIRIDTDQVPFKFWCYDLMGRPITLPMREVMSQFLWEHWGVKDISLQDVTEENK